MEDIKTDDFEREVESELSSSLELFKSSFLKKISTDPSHSSGSSSSSTNVRCKMGQKQCEKFYDDVYFDSDDSETEELITKSSGPETRKGHKRILSNEELFYDPSMDDYNQEWVDKLRSSYQVRNKKWSSCVPKDAKNYNCTPSSDAVLNCPACLTMLSIDCQRHEVYHNQFRAMFVFNCNVKCSEVLKFPKSAKKKKTFNKDKKEFDKFAQSGTRGHQVDIKVVGNPLEETEKNLIGDNLVHSKVNVTRENHKYPPSSSDISENCNLVSDDDEIFHPVFCNICNTKVAVYDKDEVYHFFNVLSSH
ncbi:E2F-associated phosphoprotein-like [Palaemon carinicauda]|uniref:E2F-associated phosphoprotein-like n=1 Tax=Palaemon carinicauda TaxID=392227 RepID=UPI0035B64313